MALLLHKKKTNQSVTFKEKSLPLRLFFRIYFSCKRRYNNLKQFKNIIN